MLEPNICGRKLFAQEHGNNNYSQYFCAKLNAMERIDEILAKNKVHLTSVS
jgi:hypothetical protein